MSRYSLNLGFVFAVLFTVNTAARGDIIVSYSGGSISAGGFGFVDVFVSSNATPLTPDSLDLFSARFLITRIGAAVAGGLQFVSPQNDSHLGTSSYVFNLDSLGETFGGPLGSVSTVTDPNDEYIGGDGTLSGLGVDLDNTTASSRLFRLDLDATLAAPGDMYSISLINDLSTSFLDPGFAPLGISSSSFDSFTVAAVPEPSAALFLVVGAVGAVCYRKRKSASNAKSAESCELDA